MRRGILVLMVVMLAAAFATVPASAAPTRCEGLFYGIEATCMLRVGGPNIEVYGAAVGIDNPQAEIVVELFKWPVSAGDSPLAWCDTDGGVLQACQKPSGTGLPTNTMLYCRIIGIAQLGTFGCATF